MIDMTDSAVEQIKKAHTQANGAPPEGGKPKIVLRIAVKRAQDGAFEYTIIPYALGVRVSGYTRDDDGFIDNTQTGQDDFNDLETDERAN